MKNPRIVTVLLEKIGVLSRACAQRLLRHDERVLARGIAPHTRLVHWEKATSAAAAEAAVIRHKASNSHPERSHRACLELLSLD